MSRSCRRAYEKAIRKVLKQAPQEADNHVIFVGHGDDTEAAGEEFQQFLRAGKAGLLAQKKTQTREILELFFCFLEYDKCPIPLEDRVKKHMAPSDDAELREGENPVPDDDGPESEIADNDQIAVGSEQNVPQAPDNPSTEAASRPPRQLHNYCLTKSAFLRYIQQNESAKKSLRAFLKYRLPHYSPAAVATSTSNPEGATLHASQNSALTSRNSTAGTSSSEERGNFVILSTPDASAPEDAVFDLLNASVHSLSYADAAELLLWLESHPPEDIARVFSWTSPGNTGKIRVQTLVSVTRFLLGLNATEAPPAEMLSDFRSLKAAIQTRRHFNEKQASLFARRAERAQLGSRSRGKAGWQGFSWILEITSWGADYMKNLRRQAFQEALDNRWVPRPEELDQKPDKAEMDGRFNEFNRDKRGLEQKVADLADSKRGLEQKVADLADSKRELEQKVADLADSKRELEQKVADLADSKRELEQKVADLADSKRELEQKFEGQKKEMAELQLWRQQIMPALNSFPGIQSAGLQK
ncbi:hypothetical protein BDZ91DRAFT_804093 [Kalaharituber pfeilii]|nr:hypothetical protein BDZ91DRAFT_804093 [Kalaharituber pfeilii]